MSKKVIQNRAATFELEPDGFSIHTIELACKMSCAAWMRLKQSLYEQSGPGEIYKIKGCERYHYSGYSAYGITITLECCPHSAGAARYLIGMVINPRKLIDPNSSYLGILPPHKKTVEKLERAFHQLFKQTGIPDDINAYQLRRADLCTNIRCDNKKIFRETVRVLRKLPTPPKYTRKYSGKKNKKEAREMDRHYILFTCGAKELVLYDKVYQVEKGGLEAGGDKLPQGVLRVELHCRRDSIRKLERAWDETETTMLIWSLIQESEARLTAQFSRCFSDAAFCQMDEIINIVHASPYKKQTQQAMCELATALQRKQSVDTALAAIQKDGYATEGILDRFAALGISPIPLWKSFCAKRIPGPVELLRTVSNGSVSVPYIKVKRK